MSLEYVSDRDSGRAMRNLVAYEFDGTLSKEFWGHIYNIGGGEACRVSTRDMYKVMYGKMGFTNLDTIIKPKYIATRNFLIDTLQYFYDAFLNEIGVGKSFIKGINCIPSGSHLMGSIIKKNFMKYQMDKHGTRRWLKENNEDHIEAYWGSKKAQEKIPEKISQVDPFKNWNTVINTDHGYNETKPESELSLKDMKRASEFRSSIYNSTEMTKEDWKTPLKFICQYGHHFTGSPRLILEGGHQCNVCERKSWNYRNRAKI